MSEYTLRLPRASKLSRFNNYKKICQLKKGMQFNLTSENETKILSYLFEMQFIGFELSATALWGYVFGIGKTSEGKEVSFINMPDY